MIPRALAGGIPCGRPARRKRRSRSTRAYLPGSGPDAGAGTCAATALWRDPASPSQEPCHERTEREAADVGEESDAAAVRRGAEQPEVRLDELVQEPQPEEDPGGDVDEEDREDVGQDPGARVEDEVG